MIHSGEMRMFTCAHERMKFQVRIRPSGWVVSAIYGWPMVKLTIYRPIAPLWGDCGCPKCIAQKVRETR